MDQTLIPEQELRELRIQMRDDYLQRMRWLLDRLDSFDKLRADLNVARLEAAQRDSAQKLLAELGFNHSPVVWGRMCYSAKSERDQLVTAIISCRAAAIEAMDRLDSIQQLGSLIDESFDYAWRLRIAKVARPDSDAFAVPYDQLCDRIYEWQAPR